VKWYLRIRIAVSFVLTTAVILPLSGPLGDVGARWGCFLASEAGRLLQSGPGVIAPVLGGILVSFPLQVGSYPLGRFAAWLMVALLSWAVSGIVLLGRGRPAEKRFPAALSRSWSALAMLWRDTLRRRFLAGGIVAALVVTAWLSWGVSGHPVDVAVWLLLSLSAAVLPVQEIISRRRADQTGRRTAAARPPVHRRFRGFRYPFYTVMLLAGWSLGEAAGAPFGGGSVAAPAGMILLFVISGGLRELTRLRRCMALVGGVPSFLRGVARRRRGLSGVVADRPGWGQYIGIFLLAMSALAFEVLLTRVLSYRYWYHYASLIIAIAMLGNGIAGTFAGFFRKRARSMRVLLPLLAVAYALFLPYAVIWANKTPYQPDPYKKRADLKKVVRASTAEQARIAWNKPSDRFGRVVKKAYYDLVFPGRDISQNRLTRRESTLTGGIAKMTAMQTGSLLYGNKDMQNQVKLYVVLIMPFLFIGMIMTLTFSAYHQSIGRFYAADLLGAGLGTVLVLLVVPRLGLEKTLWGVAFLGAGGALGYAAHLLSPKRFRWWAVPIVLVVAGALVWTLRPVIGVKAHGIQIPSVKYAARSNQPYVEYWDNNARVSLVSRFRNLISIYTDWSCFTMVQRHGAGLPVRMALYRNHYGPYRLRPLGVSCIVGAGGGRDINAHLDARRYTPAAELEKSRRYTGDRDRPHVDGIELNPTIVRVMRSRDSLSLPTASVYPGQGELRRDVRAFSGNLAGRDNVNITHDEGRSYIRSHGRLYDLIIQNNAYTFSAVSSGAFSLAENYLMTIEAFEEYWRSLRPGGIVYISRPYIEGPRLTALVREFFRRRGELDQFPASYAMYIVRPKDFYDVNQIYIKKGRFDRWEINALNRYYRRLKAVNIDNLKERYAGRTIETGYSPLIYTPFMGGASYSARAVPRERQMTRQNQRYIWNIIFAPTDEQMKRVVDYSATEIRPSTDEWPFFSQRARWLDFINIDNAALDKVAKFFPQSLTMIRDSITIVFLMSILFILAPLLFSRSAGLRGIGGGGLVGAVAKWQFLVYFAMLGFAFMFLEIHFMQRFSLCLGVPIYAIVTVLASMLVCSGIGSWVMQRLPAAKRSLWIGLGGIVAAGVLYLLTGDILINAVMGSSLVLRILLAAVMSGVPAFFMGMMLPGAMAVVSHYFPRAVAWGWAINSFASVMGALLANLLAIFLGLDVLVQLALVMYTVGTLLFIAIPTGDTAATLPNEAAGAART